MPTNLDKYREALRDLISVGEYMALDLTIRAKEQNGELDSATKKIKAKLTRSFEGDYQLWYTESLAVVRQLVSERLAEFEGLYRGEARRRGITADTYTIQDWLNGVRSGEDWQGTKHFNDFAINVMKYQTQLAILKSCQARFDSVLLDIEEIVRADLFDNELDAARELAKNGFLRAGGVMAGVVLEGHLGKVCATHSLRTRKKNPTISDWNDLLKGAAVIDVPVWRFIQRLGDLRNLCAHDNLREPTKDEVTELIDGVGKVSKTVY